MSPLYDSIYHTKMVVRRRNLMHYNAQSLSRQLAHMLTDARKRTLELVSDLNDEQMMGPKLRIVNPPLWEIGHLAWFQELWNLRRRDDGTFGPSVLKNTDELYNSMEVAHNTRWDLPLLTREETLSYMQRVLDDTLHKLNTEGPTDDNVYFALLATFHEDMHGEADVVVCRDRKSTRLNSSH